MKKYKVNLLLFLLVGWYSFGQSPNWQVNENNFQYTMTFVAFLTIDGQNLDDTNDRVAAFVNGECRGVTNLKYVASKDQYYAYLTVFSNNNGETVKFKIYDASTDEIKDVESTKNFEINQHYGDLFQTFSIASPDLSSEANPINFDFTNVTVKDQVIDGNQMTLFVGEGINRTSLNAIFELSSGATLYANRELITSGANALNFNDPIIFEILSEDRSVVKEFSVIVNFSSSNIQYYKKDAVCYAGGAIKVVSTAEGKEVTLLKSGSTVKSGIITDGEYVFDELEASDYTVKLSGNNKNITINLKN